MEQYVVRTHYDILHDHIHIALECRIRGQNGRIYFDYLLTVDFYLGLLAVLVPSLLDLVT